MSAFLEALQSVISLSVVGSLFIILAFCITVFCPPEKDETLSSLPRSRTHRSHAHGTHNETTTLSPALAVSSHSLSTSISSSASLWTTVPARDRNEGHDGELRMERADEDDVETESKKRRGREGRDSFRVIRFSMHSIPTEAEDEETVERHEYAPYEGPLARNQERSQGPQPERVREEESIHGNGSMWKRHPSLRKRVFPFVASLICSLSVCDLLGNSFWLSQINSKGPECVAFGYLAAYFSLTSYLWMALLSISIYRMVVRRFSASGESFIYYNLIAWISPLCIIITLVGFNKISRGTNGCWFSPQDRWILAYWVLPLAILWTSVAVFSFLTFFYVRRTSLSSLQCTVVRLLLYGVIFVPTSFLDVLFNILYSGFTVEVSRSWLQAATILVASRGVWNAFIFAFNANLGNTFFTKVSQTCCCCCPEDMDVVIEEEITSSQRVKGDYIQKEEFRTNPLAGVRLPPAGTLSSPLVPSSRL